MKRGKRENGSFFVCLTKIHVFRKYLCFFLIKKYKKLEIHIFIFKDILKTNLKMLYHVI